MPQFKAKKNTYIMTTANTPVWESLDANIDTVMTMAKLAYMPDMNAYEDIEEVVVNDCANAWFQKK